MNLRTRVIRACTLLLSALGCMALALTSGCGEEPAKPAPAPAAEKPAGMGMEHSTAKTAGPMCYVCPKCGMTADKAGECAHDKAAMVAKPAAYACMHDGVAMDKPGECPKCKMALVLTPISNPDPARCANEDDGLDYEHYGVVAGKLYGFCCGDCEAEMKEKPEEKLKEAQARADAAKAAAPK